jgi:hypothetical protein
MEGAFTFSHSSVISLDKLPTAYHVVVCPQAPSGASLAL